MAKKELPHQVKDLDGKIFGRITVLGFYKIINHLAIWKCRCSCGIVKYIPSRRLLSQGVKSCGCLRNESAGSRYKELKGKVFTRLKVLERIGSNKRGSALWLCECRCGNKVRVPSGSLLSGNTRSCGCLGPDMLSKTSLKDLTGQVFGRLVVLKRDLTRGRKPTKWLCRCRCGSTTSVLSRSLLDSATKSCGCLHREMVSNYFFKDLTGEKFGKLEVLRYIKHNGLVRWVCRCECGNETSVNGGSLTSGNTRSCGCSRGFISEGNLKRNVKKNFGNMFSIYTNCRPAFLKGLEYDIYIPDLNLAIEYNGIQHYKYNTYFHKNKQEFKEQKKRDLRKKRLSDKNGINLLIIKYKDQHVEEDVTELIIDYMEDLLPFVNTSWKSLLNSIINSFR